MSLNQHVSALVDSILRVQEHQPHELLSWFAADVLADLGIPHREPPPATLRPWLAGVTSRYARAVAEHPFEDVLGLLYQELGSSGKRSAMGQFFTPGGVGALIGAIAIGGDREAGPKPDGGLWRACEPACGSGALILGFLRGMCERHGPPSLRHWSVTAIDLDALCTTVCAAQVLANLLLNRGELGEFVVYQGNALGPCDRLSVVVHMTVRDLSPDLILPARHPSRLVALRSAARTMQAQPQAGSAQCDTGAPLEAAAAMGTAPPLAKHRAHGPSVAVAQEVDLFAE